MGRCKPSRILTEFIPFIWASALLLFRGSVVFNSLGSHGLQHTRLPCPSPSPRVCSNSCPLSQWCHPTILSSVAHFSSHPQSFPASGSFPVSGLFESGGQSIGASALASVFPMNSQGWFSLGLTGLISLLPKGLSRVFSSTTVQKHQSKSCFLIVCILNSCLPCVHAKLLQLCLTLCDPVGLQPTRLLCPWDSPGKNTGVGCHSLFQGLFLIRVWTCISYLSSISMQILYH